MIDREFAAGIRIELHRKDIGLALDNARAMGLALPQTAGAPKLMEVAAAHDIRPRSLSPRASTGSAWSTLVDI